VGQTSLQIKLRSEPKALKKTLTSLLIVATMMLMMILAVALADLKRQSTWMPWI
jgi:hypothetical protein